MISKRYNLDDIGEFTLSIDSNHVTVSGALAGDFFDGPIQAVLGSTDPAAPNTLADILMVAGCMGRGDTEAVEFDELMGRDRCTLARETLHTSYGNMVLDFNEGRIQRLWIPGIGGMPAADLRRLLRMLENPQFKKQIDELLEVHNG